MGVSSLKEVVFLGLYAVVFYVFLIWSSVQLSSDYANAGKLRGLKQGWISSYVDHSDAQWRNFRQNLPILMFVMSAFVLIGHALKTNLALRSKGMSFYWLLVSAIYITYMHGACVVFVGTIALGNYALTKIFGGRPLLPFLLWFYNLSFLVLNRVYEGYSFASFGDKFSYLDRYRGNLRWQISFNMVMLRMVSFGFDYHWACLSRPSTVDWKKHNINCPVCGWGGECYPSRQDKHLPKSCYNLMTYLSYLIYAPLYIAGPIITFNAFTSQLEIPQTSHTKKNIFVYGIRWVCCLLLMEVLTHTCYYNSFAVSGVWPNLTPAQIFMVGYGVLNFMWLKFLLIWRFFRFWALVSGIETPENMLRCVNNCYDLEGFWKSWHSSYNRWLVRYVYVPLGGAKWRLLNVWLIFTFVAVWHDLEWKLVSWAWVTCVLWIPEILTKLATRTTLMKRFAKMEIAYGECCAVASAFNIAGLMVANLIGFVVGPSGMKEVMRRLMMKKNTLVIFGIMFSLYVGAKIMFIIRKLEVK